MIDYLQSKEKIGVVELKHHDRTGEVIFITVIENFKFDRILNLLDYDWNESDVKKIKVEFSYDKAIFFDSNQYKSYKRKLKIIELEKVKD